MSVSKKGHGIRDICSSLTISTESFFDTVLILDVTHLWFLKCMFIARKPVASKIPRIEQETSTEYIVMFTCVCSIRRRVRSLGGFLEIITKKAF